MRKILFIAWKGPVGTLMMEEFKNADFEVQRGPSFEYQTDIVIDEKVANDLVSAIMADVYEFVFTMNYFPVVAMACKACKVKYVSWVYDTAYVPLFSKTIDFDTNYIFLYDQDNYNYFLSKGIETVHYLPLAAPVSYYDTFVPTAEQAERFGCDISFVGNLYRGADKLFEKFGQLDEYTKGYLDALVLAQRGVYGCNFLESALNEGVVNKMRQLIPLTQSADSNVTDKWMYANFYLARRVTAMERSQIARQLSEQYAFKLFTDDDTAWCPSIRNMGGADYFTEAPLVFRESKINLNITLRSIINGIPLRAFDILGCGGFLLTNFQREFLDFFEPFEDFVYYENQEDLFAKIDYYLEHEDKRVQIARNGYEKIKQNHTYEHRRNKILEVIG